MLPTRVHCGLMPILFCFLCSTISAQPIGTHRDSLQWMTARADVIVRGRIESAVPMSKSYTGFYLVTLKTESRIAGQVGERVCFVISYRKRYLELEKQGHSGLFFLVHSQFDFTRYTRFYLHSRCPFMCKNMIDLDDNSVSAASFDATGLQEVIGAPAILARVKQYLATLKDRQRTKSFNLHEPNQKAYTGYDAILTVPLDRHLYAVAKTWSTAGGIKARVGKDIKSKFAEILPFHVAKAKYAGKPQLPTDWHHANTLSIDSLEWMASDSDVIVRGTIDDLVMVQKGDYKSRKSYEVTLDVHLVKLRVDETIKGEVADTISLTIYDGGRLSKWKKKKTPLVLFLKDWAMQVEPKRLVNVAHDYRVPPVVRYAGRGTDTKAIIALDTDHPKVFSASNGWLDDPRKMLAIVRSYLAQEPSGRQSRSLEHSRLVSFKPPADFFLRDTPWENNRYVRMKFPIDAYLEKQARRWLTSDRKEQRWLGAYCLVYFKSDENTQVLRKLLNDPGKWPKPVKDEIYTRQEVTYLVRREAWTVLNAWGCDDPKPRFSD